ncbi:MAG: hypothetical protein A3F11_01745 [Gammaproteobacteria bacterium RIFCSPHIGHO2_12_FULL_37_14]|nr:MAG: hypothetical protein A3F11_01745 [Gammaproteobacteria bacterium RIFCSPHIGHO2_12_FULL_37_14]
MRKLIYVFSIAIAILNVCSAQAAIGQFREFIIDTDMGMDDAMAISYILKHPNISVKAILIEGNGDAHCRPAYANAIGLLKLLHYTTIPIACGRSKSFVGGHVFPERFRNISDTFANQLLPQISVTSPKLTAHDLLIMSLQSAASPIDILALGPLTTLAEVLEQQPNLKNKIRMIYMMGGAITVPGNIIDVDPTQNNRVAEWNIYFDPYAANKVFHSGVAITLVPLDVTNTVPLDMFFYERIKSKRLTPAAEFVYRLLDKNKQQINSNWYFWDSLAAVIATNEEIASIKLLPLSVRLSPESYSGATVIDTQNGAPIRVCLGVADNKFKNILLNGLN